MVAGVVRIFALIMKDDEYGGRIVENVCSRGFSSWILGLHEFVEAPPVEALLNGTDTLEAYLPDEMPKCDLVLSLGLPPELQALVPVIAKRAGAKAVIAAVDDPNWIPAGLRRQMIEELEEASIAYAFPKPLCSLEKVGNPYIDEFAEHFGRPRLRIEVRKKTIGRVEVLRGSPCGSTWYIAEKLVGLPVEPREKLWEQLAKAHHVYPCLASMQTDPEIGDTILHKSQYIIREAVEDALSSFKCS